jgi:hypothetical protein
LKTGINEYSSSWVQILSKAEALETAEVAIAELAPVKKEEKHEREEGEVPSHKSPPKKKAKTSFYCKMHGPDQRHNTENCKVINAEIEKLKGQKPSYNNHNNNGQQSGNNTKTAWNKAKKRQAISYSTKQL